MHVKQNEEQSLPVPVPVRSRRGGEAELSGDARTRRPTGVLSEGSSDRRRLAIVELDSPAPPSLLPRTGIRNQGTSSPAAFPGSLGSLKSRRGLHIRDLALVAPPDASPTTYTDLTPPPSAPVGREYSFDVPQSSLHSRSASAIAHSDAQRHLRHKSSRDVGIVGTTEMHPISERAGTAGSGRRTDELEGLKPPIFQTPTKSRSPSPSVRTPDLSDSATSVNEPFQVTPVTSLSSKGTLHTPEIGEGKDIRQPVVGPVVVNLGSDEAILRQHISTQSPPNPSVKVLGPRGQPVSPYLYYEPGVHATAGPLPPPPKSIFEADNRQPSLPPPRPPRLRTPAIPQSTIPDFQSLKESLQLPKKVSEKLASRSSSRVDLTTSAEGSLRAGDDRDRCVSFVEVFRCILIFVEQSE